MHLALYNRAKAAALVAWTRAAAPGEQALQPSQISTLLKSQPMIGLLSAGRWHGAAGPLRRFLSSASAMIHLLLGRARINYPLHLSDSGHSRDLVIQALPQRERGWHLIEKLRLGLRAA